VLRGNNLLPGKNHRIERSRLAFGRTDRRFIFLAVLLCSASMSGSAADNGGNYAIWGLGGSSCHAFLKAQDEPTAEHYRVFLMGYLTAFNTLSSDTYSATAEQSLEDSIDAIRTYCDGNQMDSFDRAVQQTLSSLYSVRLRESPGTSQVWRRSVEPNPQ
jgi:hypothetical protein